MYIPSRGFKHTPADANLFYKDIEIKAEDGVVTRGWFMSGKDKKTEISYPEDETPLLVFMHENAGNLGHRIPYYNFVIESLGVNILSMAYRGYSNSDDVAPNEEGIKKDADALVKFLRNPEGIEEFVNQ